MSPSLGISLSCEAEHINHMEFSASEDGTSAEEVAVAFAADENIAIGLYVSVYSLVRHASRDPEYFVYILDGGLSERTRYKVKKLEEIKDNVEIKLINKYSNTTRKLKDPERVGRSAYLRFVIPGILDGRHDKIIYLDSDTLVNKDIYKVSCKNMDENIVMATQDFLLPRVRDAQKYTQMSDVFGLPGDEPYFNSGVLLIDVEKWNEENISDKCIDAIYNNNDKLVMDDQDALNGVLYKRWGILDPRWNVQLNWMEKDGKVFRNESLVHKIGRENILNDPGITHYNVRKKPWEMGTKGVFRKRYLDYLKSSGWFSKDEYYRYVFTKYAHHAVHECYDFVAEASRPIRHSLRRSLSRDA